MKRRVLLIMGLLLIASQYSFAKRSAPELVDPVMAGGVKYLAPHVAAGYREAHGFPTCPVGCVEAWDEKTGKLLWQTQVYEVTYDKRLERDVQDVFIRSLEFKDGNLRVENEQGARFAVDLKTHVAKKRWQPWK